MALLYVSVMFYAIHYAEERVSLQEEQTISILQHLIICNTQIYFDQIHRKSQQFRKDQRTHSTDKWEETNENKWMSDSPHCVLKTLEEPCFLLLLSLILNVIIVMLFVSII